MSAERVAFFTDAVFAIAMTLLVIEIPRPEGDEFEPGDGVSKWESVTRLWHFLAGEFSSFYAYVLAFWILWIVWRQHHTLFDRVHRVSPAMIRWHFALLLLVGFLPYVTTVQGHYPENPAAALLFGLVVGALLACRSGIQHMAYRDEVLRPPAGGDSFRAEVVVSWLVVGYWALTLAFIWWTPWGEIVWFATPLAGNAIRWGYRRWTSRGAAPDPA